MRTLKGSRYRPADDLPRLIGIWPKESDGLGGLYYGVTLSYYLNMIYGGQLLDATLLWKLWLCLLVVRCIRTGHLARTRFGIAQAGTTFALYGYGLLQLVLG